MNFDTMDGGSFDLLKCSCSTSKQQRARLDAFPKGWRTDVEALILQEKADYCVHTFAVDVLMEEDEDGNDENDSEEELIVDILSLDPPLVAVYDGHSYGLVGYKRISKLQCLLCDHRCHHVRHLKDWCNENDVHLDKEEPLMEEQSFNSVSYRPIPYPLPLHLRNLHDKHERGGVEFPIELIPPYDATLKCEHGHAFDSGDPVYNQWISRKNAIIYKAATTIEDENRATFYRPSLGSCNCRQLYDGQDDLLFNLDGKHLFYYGYLFQYLHLMLEGKNPLIAFLRASTRSILVQSHTMPVSIKLLRQAWNAFARCLSINFAKSFACPICGESPRTIVCDGTLIGFRKDLMVALDARNSCCQSQQVQGSNHASRILLKTRESRELLQKYSGYTRDRKCARNPKQLTPSELNLSGSKRLAREGASSLVEVITRLSQHAHVRIAPPPYRELFFELSLNTPICGLLQIAGDEEVIHVIQLLAKRVDVRQSCYQLQLKLLQDRAPLFASFILKLPFDADIPDDVCTLINHLCILR